MKNKKEKSIYEISKNPNINASLKALGVGSKSLLSDPVYEENKDLNRFKDIANEIMGGKKADPKIFNLSDNDNTNALIRAGARMIRSFTKEEAIANNKLIKIVKDIIGIKNSQG